MITCAAHYCLRCLNLNLQWNICSVHMLGEQQREGSDPSRCSSTSLLGFPMFSWCNMLSSWQSGRTSAALRRRCSLSRDALWLEFWSCEIFRSLVFSVLAALHLFPLSACVCVAQNNEFLILLSCICCRTSLMWILSKSPIPPFLVGFPLKVIVSLKPINAGSFKTTFALLKEMVSAGGCVSFQIKVCPTLFLLLKNDKVSSLPWKKSKEKSFWEGLHYMSRALESTKSACVGIFGSPGWWTHDLLNLRKTWSKKKEISHK